MKLFGNNKKVKHLKSKLKSYPCEDYLHNALYFLAHQNPAEAYSEICYAMDKAGVKLSENERNIWQIIFSEKNCVNT